MTGSGDRASAPAARGFRGKLWFWLPWPLLVVLDLWSKAAVFGFLEGDYGTIHEQRRSHQVFDTDLLRFEFVSWLNTGTIWGLFQDGTVVLMIVRCFAVIGLFWFLHRTARTAKLQQLVLSLILAGALGNLYDNFTRADRAVRDFLFFSGRWPWEWTFPAFNVADSCITCGAIALFLLLWREGDGERAAHEDRAAKAKQVD